MRLDLVNLLQWELRPLVSILRWLLVWGGLLLGFTLAPSLSEAGDNSEAAPIKFGATVPWDFVNKNPDFVPYSIKLNVKAIEHTEATSSPHGWTVTRRQDRCVHNPEWKKVMNEQFFLYPLFGGVSCEKWNMPYCQQRYQEQRNQGKHNPYLPVPHNGAVVDFFSKKLPTSIPDFEELVHSDHFIFLPPNARKLEVELNAVESMGHEEFDFPVGTILVHRLFLNDSQHTPLEWRYLQKTKQQWLFGVYEAPGIVDPAKPAQELILRTVPSGSMKVVLRHLNKTYGEVAFRYPVASALPYLEYNRTMTGAVVTTTTNTCVNCHFQAKTLRSMPEARLALLKSMQTLLDHDSRPRPLERYAKEVREEEQRQRLQRSEQRRLEAQLDAQKASAGANGGDNRQPRKKRVPSEAQCDSVATFVPGEGSIPSSNSSLLTTYLQEKRGRLRKFLDPKQTRPESPETIGHDRPQLMEFARPQGKPCGFAPAHPELMNFMADLEGFRRSFESRFGHSPFERQSWKPCSLSEARQGTLITLDDSRLWDQLTQKRIGFRVNTIDSDGTVRARADDEDHFKGLVLELRTTGNGQLTYSLEFPPLDPFYFSLTDAGILGLEHSPQQGRAETLLCRRSEEIQNPSAHAAMESFPSMTSPSESQGGRTFFNAMWIQNLMATRVLEPWARSGVSAPSHGMGAMGRTFNNGNVLRFQWMVSADQLAARSGYINPLSAGELNRQGQLYRGSVHDHPSFLGLEAQVGKRWGANNQNSLLFSTGPMGRAPVGPNFESMTASGYIQRPFDDHHATRIWHSMRSPVTFTYTRGDGLSNPQWLFQAGVYSGRELVPSQHDFRYYRPDSGGFRLERTWTSNNSRTQQMFGVSAAWQNTLHAQAQAQSQAGDPHHKTKPEFERYFLVYHEIQKVLSDSLRFATMNVYSKKDSDGLTLNTLSNRFIAYLGASGKHMLIGGARFRQLSPKEFEIEVINPETGMEFKKRFNATSLNLGYGRRLKKFGSSELVGSVEYQGSWVPRPIFEGMKAGWPATIGPSHGHQRVDQFTVNLWLYWRKGHRH